MTMPDFGAVTDELERTFSDMDGKAADKALQAGAEVILRQMLANYDRDLHVKTGILRRSIHVYKPANNKSGRRVKIGSDAPHAHLVEYGHGGPHPAGPHPFVRSAFDTAADEAYNTIKQELSNTGG